MGPADALSYPTSPSSFRASSTLVSKEHVSQPVLRPKQVFVVRVWSAYTVPPCQVGEDPWGRERAVLLPAAILHSSLLSFLAQEEGDDCTLGVHRRLHNSLERSELPAKQGPLEPGRARAEERLRPARPCAEDN